MSERRLTYVVYMLVGEAKHWWRGTHHMLTARGIAIDWECFRRVFLEKYFPESVRHAKEAEFMWLHQGGMTVSEQPSSAASGGRQGGGATLRCYRCVGPHLIKDCPHTESRCFKCQQMGHESFNCLTRNRPERGAQRSDVQRGDAQRGDRPTTAGRVFALTGAETSTSSNLVKGKGKAAGKDVMFLFDSGASHSFISYACAVMLGVPVCDLGLRILVSTLASTSVIASELCAGCPIVVNGK
ncbi:uncharacterized protein LOC109791545, partial [Cajanus cajan]|uniref:uncharacterized protein LOC109791545 n=1 Tax=Cajanus cajan TaxID=3821 RepID=UPI00098D8BAB